MSHRVLPSFISILYKIFLKSQDFTNNQMKAKKEKKMAEFTFEIEEHLLTLSENEKGWTKEFNRVSFNGACKV